MILYKNDNKLKNLIRKNSIIITMEKTELSKEHQLMYDLIFSNKEVYEIDLFEYITEIKFLEDFINRLLLNLEESGVKIKDSTLILTEEKKSWVLKIKR